MSTELQILSKKQDLFQREPFGFNMQLKAADGAQLCARRADFERHGTGGTEVDCQSVLTALNAL